MQRETQMNAAKVPEAARIKMCQPGSFIGPSVCITRLQKKK
jgi:hypothetical protein